MAAEGTATFAEHVSELRRRLMWALLFVAIGGGIGYAMHEKLLAILQKPLNQTLYYTSPTGAFSFIIKICVVFGLVVALPVITYQVFSFFGPIIKTQTRRLFVWYIFCSVFLAGLGMMFAYFVSLPAALHFLVNFGGGDIKSLITANEYFNFVLAYLAGFALLFQLPLILTFINRITPLTPRRLLGATRYVIVASFILSAIITPTPDPMNQGLMAGPVILLYFLSSLMIIIRNLKSKPKTRVEKKTEQFMPAFATPKPQPIPKPNLKPSPVMAAQVSQPQRTTSIPARPARPISDISRPQRRNITPDYKRRQTPVRAADVPVRPMSSKPRLISDFFAPAD